MERQRSRRRPYKDWQDILGQTPQSLLSSPARRPRLQLPARLRTILGGIRRWAWTCAQRVREHPARRANRYRSLGQHRQDGVS
jgi:hypothetical protein